MKYPAEFPAEVQDRIETEKIRAYRDLRASPLVPVGLELFSVVDRCIMRIFSAYAKEACELRAPRGWTMDKVNRDAEEFLRQSVIMVVREKAPQLRGLWLDDWLPGSATVRRLVECSPEWKQFQEDLLTENRQAQSSENSGRTGPAAETAESSRPTSRPVDRGKFCDQVIGEVKRIKNLHHGTGRSVAEIEKDHPDFAVWKVRASLSPDDQETFNHPNRWGAPIGYAKMILSKTHNASTHTISSWVKAHRKDRRAKKT
jgi:hypothetical protein